MDNAINWFHLNSENEVVGRFSGTLEESLTHARKWNKGEKRPHMVVELVCSDRKPAKSTRVAAVA